MKELIIFFVKIFAESYNYELASILANDTMILVNIIGSEITLKFIKYHLLTKIGGLVIE